MLQIAVQNSDDRGIRGENAFHDRGGQSTSADPLQHAHARIGAGQPVQYLYGAVTQIVIDKDYLPCQPGEAAVEPVREFRRRYRAR